MAKELNVNYRTVLHHLEILEKNGLIRSEGPKYGALYFVSDIVETNSDWFNSLLGKRSEAPGGLRVDGYLLAFRSAPVLSINGHSLRGLCLLRGSTSEEPFKVRVRTGRAIWCAVS
ncbi:MAG: hypothetical protein ACP5UU_03535 [Thermoprotei archaeon]